MTYLKKITLILIGFLLYPVACDVAWTMEYYGVIEKRPVVFFVPEAGIATVLVGGCTKDVSKNGHGTVFVNREYFQCSKAQILVSDLIFGEKSGN